MRNITAINPKRKWQIWKRKIRKTNESTTENWSVAYLVIAMYNMFCRMSTVIVALLIITVFTSMNSKNSACNRGQTLGYLLMLYSNLKYFLTLGSTSFFKRSFTSRFEHLIDVQSDLTLLIQLESGIEIYPISSNQSGF